MRPSVFERAVGAFVVGPLVLVLFAGVTTSLPRDPSVLAFLVFPFVAGVMLSGFRRRGAAVRREAIELHTVVSCSRIPLGEVVRLHVGPYLSGLAVECRDVTVLLGDGTNVPQERILEMVTAVRRLGQQLGVPVEEYEDSSCYVDAIRPVKRAGWTIRGLGPVVRWPEVWITVLLGALLVVPLAYAQ